MPTARWTDHTEPTSRQAAFLPRPFRQGMAGPSRKAACRLFCLCAAMLLAGCQQWDWQTKPVTGDDKTLQPADPPVSPPDPKPSATLATAEPVVEPVPTPPAPAIIHAPADPKIRVVHLGDSVQGRPIVMHLFGEGDETAFIMGGIHGSEHTSAYVAERLLAYLSEHRELYRDRCIAVLSRANPDGLARRTRTNAHGVDLNRNFPASNYQSSPRYGPRPASEPETRAILAAMARLKPCRTMAIHSTRRGRHCNNYDGPGRDLAHALHACNGYRILPVWGAPTPGSFGTYAGIDRKIPTITLELPNDLTGSQCWTDNQRALVAFIESAAGTAQTRTAK